MSIAAAASKTSEVLHPLPLVYCHEHLELPLIDFVNAASLSPAANRLLVHSGDMTSKLEAHYNDQMLLTVLHQERDNGTYRREVLLHTAKSDLPVEYGAIEINLSQFDPLVRDEILEGRLPLGGLMNSHGVRYRSEPRAFIRVTPDSRLVKLFGLSSSASLFGRSNVLLGASGETLACIVEILRPV